MKWKIIEFTLRFGLEACDSLPQELFIIHILDKFSQTILLR